MKQMNFLYEQKYSPLNLLAQRDIVIMNCLENKISLFETEQILYSLGEKLLSEYNEYGD
jgi:hypothetical protein